MPSYVAIAKGERSHDTVYKALDLIDYKTALKGFDKALIKVNFITTKTWDTGATTDPLVVEAILNKLALLPITAYVVESDATMTNADKAFEVTGMKTMCDQNGVECLNLRHMKPKVKLKIPDGDALKSIIVPKIATEAAIVSAAKLKTHTNTAVTLGMKNMFGMLPDKYKGKYHLKGISKVVVDINSVLKPKLTVIDGFIGMEGRGPVDGTPVKMDTIIAGTDVVATDATACHVMGIDPHKVKHIIEASAKGIGTIDNVQILGEKIENVTRPFKTAKSLQ
jgi:uncharacterized protein (DUF362 family)